jgi:hypothetical protein
VAFKFSVIYLQPFRTFHPLKSVLSFKGSDLYTLALNYAYVLQSIDDEIDNGISVVRATHPCDSISREGAEQVFDRHTIGCIERYLQRLWGIYRYTMSNDIEYVIGMVWSEDSNKRAEKRSKNRMVDLWLNSQVENRWGPLVEVQVFREFERYFPWQNMGEGHTSGHTLRLLAKEEEHRVAVGDLKKYLSDPRPVLPEDIRMNEDFYLK